MFYVEVVKDTPIQGRKWIIVLRSCSSGNYAMKGVVHYRYKKDATPMKKALEQALGKQED